MSRAMHDAFGTGAGGANTAEMLVKAAGAGFVAWCVLDKPEAERAQRGAVSLMRLLSLSQTLLLHLPPPSHASSQPIRYSAASSLHACALLRRWAGEVALRSTAVHGLLPAIYLVKSYISPQMIIQGRCWAAGRARWRCTTLLCTACCWGWRRRVRQQQTRCCGLPPGTHCWVGLALPTPKPASGCTLTDSGCGLEPDFVTLH